MAKKKPTTDEAPLKHNPFAALAPATQTQAADRAALTKPSRSVEQAPVEQPADERWGSGKLVLRREKKGRGGKTVTRVEGIRKGQLKSVAAEMKRALGCGAKVDGDAILLLGSLVDRAGDWLTSQGAPRVVKGN